MILAVASCQHEDGQSDTHFASLIIFRTTSIAGKGMRASPRLGQSSGHAGVSPAVDVVEPCTVTIVGAAMLPELGVTAFSIRDPKAWLR